MVLFFLSVAGATSFGEENGSVEVTAFDSHSLKGVRKNPSQKWGFWVDAFSVGVDCDSFGLR